jgi:hypothetical protein
MTAPSIERRTIASREDRLMRRWADATRHHRWDEADELLQKLIAQSLTAPIVNQEYWNDLLDRRMAVLERRQQRSTVSDDEWDRLHEDVNR